MPRYQNKGTYLLVEISEPYSLKVFLTMIHDIAEHCQQEKISKVLIDGRAVAVNPSILERFQIGIEIAKTWRSNLRVASVARESVLNRMAENTAVNRGSRVFATTRMEEALKWLEAQANSDQP